MFVPVEYAAWLCWGIPFLAALFVPLVAKLRRKWVGWYAVFVTAISVINTLSLLSGVLNGHGEAEVFSIPWMPAMGIDASVLIDPLSTMMANIAACIGLLIMIYSVNYMEKEKATPRFFFFMLLFIGGMLGLVMANNLLQMYFFWETVGLCSYSLIGFWYNRTEAAKAGMKAFIVTRVGDIFLLLGILILYVNTGTFNFLEIKELILAGQVSVPALAISILMLIGAVGKSAQVPLHVWLPNAMEGPTPTSALIHGATMVKAGIYLVARIYILFSFVTPWLTTITYVGGITAFLAATMALTSSDMKRVLAFSTISQLGMIMSALGIGTELGWFASQFHVISHALFKSLLFLCAGVVMHATHTLELNHLGGLRKAMPITFIVSVIGAFSLAGIPPFSGFWSKDTIFEAIIQANNIPLFILIFGTSLLTAIYSIRWICKVFLGKRSEFLADHHFHDPKPIIYVPLIILAAASCIMGFFKAPLEHYLQIHAEISTTGVLLASETSAVILAIAIPTAYYLYYKRRSTSLIFSRSLLNHPFYLVTSNGYYFDAVYNKILNGIMGLSHFMFKFVETAAIQKFPYAVAGVASKLVLGTLNYVESFLDRFVYIIAGVAVVIANKTLENLDAFLDRFCYILAGGTVKTARVTHETIDTFLNKMVYLFAGTTVKQGEKLKKIHRGHLPDFVLAAAIGFIIIVILLLFTSLR
ncbi:MAG: NADH-quinone oxidoreductase subunit L [Candidatus Bathyarchaeota archaeon]|nr:NADH-quinone oxidoreductase subunit L [Candidatus Bathyarchaeum tardum]WGM88883.1 MAG: NADH-quinone oxidoreductase subunit L [Candidatus Bathyarchaeum tardum]WNZ28875.1 MAG: NADH-quinone oxidoreductase subunit L [Candidatus Bathyarchaeota archaeon]